jgi:hypothetical protein
MQEVRMAHLPEVFSVAQDFCFSCVHCTVLENGPCEIGKHLQQNTFYKNFFLEWEGITGRKVRRLTRQ